MKPSATRRELEELCDWCRAARMYLAAFDNRLDKVAAEEFADQLDAITYTIWDIKRLLDELECGIIDTVAGKVPNRGRAVDRRQAEALEVMKDVLTPDEQTVYRMLVVEGWYTQKEVGDALGGLSQPWVSTLKKRAIAKMNKAVGWVPYGST